MRVILAILIAANILFASDKVQRSKPDNDGNTFFIYQRPDGMEKCYRINDKGNRKAISCDDAKDLIKKLGKDVTKFRGNPKKENKNVR